ncbi:MAG: hypothetical protein GVY16_02715 [Planctomycetes bacterium]|nr:hypothetical protein [Planctomycetota bacterium]
MSETASNLSDGQDIQIARKREHGRLKMAALLGAWLLISGVSIVVIGASAFIYFHPLCIGSIMCLTLLVEMGTLGKFGWVLS